MVGLATLDPRQPRPRQGVTPPHWATTVEEYLRWFDHKIECSGGLLRQSFLRYEPFEVIEKLGEGYEHTTVVGRHDLVFPGVGVLEFRLILVEHLTPEQEPVDVEQATYSYHFRTEEHPMLWRYDKHLGHPGVGECHIHRSSRFGRERVESCPEVDIDDIVRIIQHDHV